MPLPAMVVGLSLWAATAGGSDLPRPYQDALAALRSAKEPSARALAAIAIAHGFREVPLPDPLDVVDALSDAMQADADPTVQAMTAYALCVLRDPRGVPRLIGAIQSIVARGVDPQGPYSDAVPLPVPYLYRALGHAGGPEATWFLIEAARTGPARSRVVAIAALGLVLGDDGEVERVLTTLSNDTDATVRSAARYVMSERKPRSGKR
jgi:HEAT repeat protein